MRFSTDVRWKAGVAASNDFGSDSGTPIVVNTTRGDLSVINDSGIIRTSLIAVNGSASLTFGSIASNGIASQTITVNGAVTGMPVMAAAPAALETGLTFSAFVSAANTVKIRLHNNSGGSITPATATWVAYVLL